MEAVVTFTDDRHYDDNLMSQEFHLTGSSSNDRMTFLVGAYYSDEENKFRQYRWSQNELHIVGPNGNVIADPDTIQYIRSVGVATGNAAIANY